MTVCTAAHHTITHQLSAASLSCTQLVHRSARTSTQLKKPFSCNQGCIPAGPGLALLTQLRQQLSADQPIDSQVNSTSSIASICTLILLAKTSTRGGLRKPSDASLTAAKCFSSLAGFLCSAQTCTTCSNNPQQTRVLWHCCQVPPPLNHLAAVAVN